MCGFVGCLDLKGRRRLDHAVLDRMTSTLVHRGPDSEGAHLDDGIALGFRRLSIVDLATGDQPLWNEAGTVVVVCNGELYNHRELRAGLEERGHVFRSRSDVEILVHLYEERGAALVDALRGQFAFALWDVRERRLLLARDRFGICPLFYTEADGQLLFASEIKALLVHPAVRRAVDLTGLDQVLALPGLVSPRTLFEGIASLPPGHLATASANGFTTREYWDLCYPNIDEQGDLASEAAAVPALAEAFRAAVADRLIADVPVGFYLSGGLDSSLIAAQVHQLDGGRARHSFSITFPESSISEQPHQLRVAQAVGSEHHETSFDWAQICARWERMIYHCECPVKETYNTCSLALSESARAAGIPVVLTGEGADELFAGYVGYRFDQGRAGERGNLQTDLEQALEAELREQVWGDPDLFYESDILGSREARRELYAEGVAAELERFDCFTTGLVNPERLRGRHPVHQRSYLDVKLRLGDHLLGDHGDRMALASSVEARFPFLDERVVDVACRTTPELKLHGLTEKYVVKRMAAALLPREIVEREKFGFHAPGSPHLLRHRREWLGDHLSPARVRRQGVFDPRAIESLTRLYSAEGFLLNLPFETDLLTVALSFSVWMDVFEMPSLA
jgi:asparagine synthase (glutamine-hydrolysing)